MKNVENNKKEIKLCDETIDSYDKNIEMCNEGIIEKIINIKKTIFNNSSEFTNYVK